MNTSELVSEYFGVDRDYVEEVFMGCDMLSDCGECAEDFINKGDLEVISFTIDEPCERTILEYANKNDRDPWEDNDSYLIEEAVIMQKSTGLKGKFFASYSKGTYKDEGQWYFSDNLTCNVKEIVEYRGKL